MGNGFFASSCELAHGLRHFGRKGRNRAIRKAVRKKKRKEILSRQASGRKSLNCVGPPDLVEQCCDCSITSTMCLQAFWMFQNPFDVEAIFFFIYIHKLINVTFGIVPSRTQNSWRVEAGEY